MSYKEPYEEDLKNQKTAKKNFKILTLCRGGQVRSVGAKYILSYKYGHDVIACGWESNSESTRELLYQWADYIIIMESKFEQYVPDKYKFNEAGERKLFCYDVGEDRFGYAFHLELQKILDGMIKKHNLFA